MGSRIDFTACSSSTRTIEDAVYCINYLRRCLIQHVYSTQISSSCSFRKKIVNTQLSLIANVAKKNLKKNTVAAACAAAILLLMMQFFCHNLALVVVDSTSVTKSAIHNSIHPLTTRTAMFAVCMTSDNVYTVHAYLLSKANW